MSKRAWCGLLVAFGGWVTGNRTCRAQELPPLRGQNDAVVETEPKFRPHFRYSVIYDDNIFGSLRNRHSDVIHSIAPGIAINLGDYQDRNESFLACDYTGAFNYFQDRSDLNALEQDGIFAAQKKWARLTFGTQLRYLTLSGGDIDVGGRVSQTRDIERIYLRYQLAAKTSFGVEGTRRRVDFKTRIDSVEWNTRFGFDYEVTPRIRIGTGVLIGVLKAERGPTQKFQQYLIGFNFAALAKLSLTGSVGLEFRDFDQGASDRVDGVFGIGGLYQPFSGTEIRLRADRRTTSSPSLIAQNITATDLQVTLRQRFLRRFYFAIAGGYRNSNYEAALDRVSATRLDDYYFVRPSIRYDYVDWWNAEIFYTYRQNQSNQQDRSFTNATTGLQIGMLF